VAVFLESHILDHRGQLMVVPNQHNSLETGDAILLTLKRTAWEEEVAWRS
jgi:hypothetical protein